MLKRLVLATLVTVVPAVIPAFAQDIAGLEDCSMAKGPDKKIGCLQSNVEFLHRLIKTSETAAQAKLNAATVKISQLQADIERLKAALEQLDKKMPPAAAPTGPSPSAPAPAQPGQKP